MKNKVLFLFVLFLAVGNMVFANQTTYYAKATARVSGNSTGYGKVYANTSNSAPSDNQYDESSFSSEGSGNGSGNSVNVDFYLFAQAKQNYGFAGWSETDNSEVFVSTNNPFTATISASSTNQNNRTSKTWYAVFKPLPIFYFSAQATSSPAVGGTASVNLTNTSVQGAAWNSTSAQTTASYSATPNDGYQCIGWSTTSEGTSIESTNNPYNKTITSTSTNSGSPTNTTMYAIFKQIPTFYFSATATPSPAAGGTASVSPSSTSAQGAAWNSTQAQTSVRYTATPNEGYGFMGWSTSANGAIENAANPYDKTITSTSQESGNPTPTAMYAIFAQYPTAVSADNITLEVGENSTITPTLTPADAYRRLTCTSSNTSVATVNSNGVVTGVSVGSATITIKVLKNDGTVACQTTITVTVQDQLPTPVIAINGSGSVTITCAVAGASIYYTVNGADPTSSSTPYTGSFTVNEEDVVKAIAVKSGYINSNVAQAIYIASSGVSNGVVTLNDLEDHTWTYYAGVDANLDPNYNTTYRGTLYSPDPRNVKITYYGNGKLANLTTDVSGVKVGIDADAHTFVYYKTIENNSGYKYTTIPNPFSVRPKINSTYYGFSSWRVKSVSGGTITGKAVGSTINAETEITFVPNDANGTGYTANCISMEVELEAVWDVAEVSTNGTFTNNYGVERMFYVFTSSSDADITANSKACTYTSIYPNGTTNGTTAATMSDRKYRRGGFTCAADSKFEYIYLNNNNSTIVCGNHYLIIGRGVSNSNGTGLSATYIKGLNSNVTNISAKMRIESGFYTRFSALRGYEGSQETPSVTGTMRTEGVLGCDYDRATNDNSKLKVTTHMYYGYIQNPNIANGNTSRETFNYTIKSGDFCSDVNNDIADASESFYISLGGTQANVGRRVLTIEGGQLLSVAGGIDENNSASDETVFIRMKGGTLRGSMYGAAAFAATKGHRRMVITGGTIKGWVAAGCNGTDPNQAGGTLPSNTFVYIGGNATIGNTAGADVQINTSYGGNVFGAGSGNSSQPTTGEVNNSNVVIADNCYITQNVYGGGNYGYASKTAKIYVTGGQVDGNVFGGANQKTGATVNIYMDGGLVKSGIYGGSNITGTVSESVTMQINGGTVGVSGVTEVDGNRVGIFGGGLGSPTIITKNVDITLGYTGQEVGTGVTVFGDVYGGSALGKTNGTSANTTYHTNVTMNAGTINGSIYGGALGNAGTAANVYSPVAVKVYGGSVKQTTADGSGGVYGANNVNGAPQRSVTVDIYGTDPAPAEGQYALYSVYGGGNKANYTYGNGYPKVTVHNCDNSIEYVYGGGNAAAVAATDVTIYGGNVIGNVFGGGNGTVTAANVSGNATTKIYGGTILNVYGGSNSQGTIGGTISVTANETTEGGHDACPIKVDNLYGGGNMAASNVGSITIGCADSIGNVYGGANQADITGNINLSITAGHVANVFGGNNTSGSISGTITVTVNDDGRQCGMEVGNVFGGGNLAQYTGSPAVNIYNGSVTGNVYGGGKGKADDHTKGQVTGNPAVTIGDNDNGHQVIIGGSVFGGGDAGNVSGTPVVNVIEKCNTVIGDADGEGVYGGGNAADVSATNVTVSGGTIRDVFGGGNGQVAAANVTNNTSVEIHGGTIERAFAGSNTAGTIGGTASITVDKTSSCNEFVKEVYGGGNQAAGNAGTVTIECGALVGDVYGGANQADINNAITLNITGGTIDRVFGGNNTSGSISGNITVNIDKDPNCNTFSVDSVFGGGNAAAYTGTPTVNVKAGTVNYNVYGGGLGSGAVVTGTPVVNLQGGTVTGKLFGGGAAANVTGSTDVNISSGTAGNVYGGGEAANVSANTDVAVTGGTVNHSVYGGGLGNTTMVSGTATVTQSAGTVTEDVYGGSGFGKVQNTAVTISGGSLRSVYGGGFGQKANAGAGLAAYEADINGNVTVTVSGGTFSGDVFGCNNQNGTPKGTVNVVIDGSTAHTLNNVYGGGNLADATITPTVTVNGCNATIADVYGGGNAAAVSGTNVVVNGGTITRVFAGGNGAVSEANVTGNAVATIHGGTISQAYAGSNTNGSIGGSQTLNIDKSGSCDEHIYAAYGGGNLAAGKAGTVNVDCTADVIDTLYGGANQANISSGNIVVNVTGGKVLNVFGGNNTSGTISGTITVNINKDDNCNNWDVNYVYGAGNKAPYTGSPTVNITKGTVDNNVYGGGLGAAAIVTGTPVVNLQGGTVTGNLFGGGSAANVTGGTDVNITSGSASNVYGGGEAATISGATDVNVSGGTLGNVYGGGLGDRVNTIAANVGSAVVAVSGGTFTGDIFGCNNQYGSPQTSASVTIDGTSAITLNNIYGGGNLADATITPNVTINGCHATITDVYGGGNAAAIAGTNVTVNGGTISRVFAGGNGVVSAANVTGNALANIHGGIIGKVFAGSNTNGTITGSQTVNVDHTSACDEEIDEVYGGGNEAYGNGGTLNICNANVLDVYGGARAANINSNIVLNIKGGTYRDVFGGNNVSGAISGTVTVNIEEDNCGEIHIRGLYGGGNQAAYTGSPTVNVKSWHTIDTVFGGGLGSTARVAGTHVNIDPTLSGEVAVANHHIGTVNCVFGGGNAAPVGTLVEGVGNGTTDVLVRNTTIMTHVFGGGLGATAVVNGNTQVSIQGSSNIGKNVYGGGSAAEVTGDTNVIIGSNE